MKKNTQPRADSLVGSRYIADALGHSQEHVSRALGSLFADGDMRVQQLGRQFVVSRAVADMLIGEWREKRPGAPLGNRNAKRNAMGD